MPASPFSQQQRQQQQQPQNYSPLQSGPGQVQNPAQASQTSTPTTPTQSQTLEQSRVALILSINTDLLTALQSLQGLSQGGALNQQQAAQLRAAGQKDAMASEEYIALLKRLQGNLAWLGSRVSSGGSEGSAASGVGSLPGPPFMLPPVQVPALKAKYEQLKALFPEWIGTDGRALASASGYSANASPVTAAPAGVSVAGSGGYGNAMNGAGAVP